MAEDRINHKELWPRLCNIKKKKVWFKAVKKLELNITQPKGGSSHYAIRLPGYENSDIKGFICNIYDPVRKDISEKVFKKLLKYGYKEDDIWKALGMLN